MITPVQMASNQPADRFYRGGESIRAFRGASAAGERVPEDWVASTTTLFGEAELGLSLLPSGETLIDAIERDPVAWLGDAHLASYGVDTKLLVKLLDAGERLPVHIHPHVSYARENLGRAHGKAEAWCILAGGSVHLGFNRAVDPHELQRWVETQDLDTMLAAMHTVVVQPGDSIYVPPGLPHAIGAGIFLVEVQEPEDLSILLEWKNFAIDGPNDGHLGLGFERALRSTDARGWSAAEIDTLVVRNGPDSRRLAAGADEYFRVERHTLRGTSDPVAVELDAGFSVLVVLDGTATLTVASSPDPMPLTTGNTVLIPHGAGTLTLTGDASVLRCRPPVAMA